jgi:hypothetical protein
VLFAWLERLVCFERLLPPVARPVARPLLALDCEPRFERVEPRPERGAVFAPELPVLDRGLADRDPELACANLPPFATFPRKVLPALVYPGGCAETLEVVETYGLGSGSRREAP